MIVKTEPRFVFTKMNGSEGAGDNSVWTGLACLAIGVLIGMGSGYWLSRGEVSIDNISEETLDRIRLGAENKRLKRELDERKAKAVVH